MTYTYIRHIPSPPLDAYIDYLYYCDGLVYPREKMLPMPTPHLVVNLGSTIQVLDALRSKPFALLSESSIIGAWSVCHIAEWPSNVQFFDIRFKPGGAYPFLRLPLSELHNQFAPLHVIWGQSAAEIRERLYAAPTIQAGFDVLERILLARLSEIPRGLKVVQDAVTETARQHGALSIRELSDYIGISQNHLLTQFKRMVGVSPKELACLYRLQHVLETIDVTKSVDWAELAQQCGYYDQAHFIKDFMARLGQSPTDYLRLRRQIQAESPERGQLLRTLPVD
jgi:AraC-like DNA-binding protein